MLNKYIHKYFFELLYVDTNDIQTLSVMKIVLVNQNSIIQPVFLTDTICKRIVQVGL